MLLDSREEFHRVIVSQCLGPNSRLIAESTGGQRSSRVASLSGANALVHLPIKTEGGPDRLNKGAHVQAVIFGELRIRG